jgi:pilus assembly protein CpaB
VSKRQKQLIFALILGLVVAFGNKAYVDSRISEYRDKNEIPIVRASASILAGNELTREMIEKVNVPEVYAPKNRIRWDQYSQYLGQRLGTDVTKGDYILPSYFSAISTVGRKLSDQVPNQDSRAVTLPVDETNSLARSVLPGDKIDIAFSFTIPPLREKFSTMLLQNVTVIATGSYSASEQELGSGGGRMKSYNTVTLGLSVLDAMRLNYARQEGKISVLLRNSNNNAIVNFPPITTIEDVLSPADREMVKQAALEQAKVSRVAEDQYRDQVKTLMEQQRKQKGPIAQEGD